MKYFLTLLSFLCTPLFFGTAFAQDSSVTVSDLYGEVTLEEQPERIVVLTDEMTEIVVTLGFTPVVPEGVEMTPQGFGTLSTEAFGSLDADTVLSVGVGERQNNAVNRLLDATGATLAYVDIGLGRPPQGPLSDLFYMERFADTIRTLYSISIF